MSLWHRDLVRLFKEYFDTAEASITKADSGTLSGAANSYDNDETTRMYNYPAGTDAWQSYAFPDWEKFCGARVVCNVPGAYGGTIYLEYQKYDGSWGVLASKTIPGAPGGTPVEIWEPTWESVVAKNVRCRLDVVADGYLNIWEIDWKVER